MFKLARRKHKASAVPIAEQSVENKPISNGDGRSEPPTHISKQYAVGSMSLTGNHLKLAHFVGLNEEKIGLLAGLADLLADDLPAITDAFYDNVISNPDLKRLIESHSSVERLRVTLAGHVRGFFAGNIDEQYVQDRMRVGAVHGRIGLPPEWYASAYAKLFSLITGKLSAKLSKADSAASADALAAIIIFDMAVTFVAFHQHQMGQIENAREQLTQQIDHMQQLQDSLFAASNELGGIARQTLAAVEAMHEATDRAVTDGRAARQRIEAIKERATHGIAAMDELREAIDISRSAVQAVEAQFQQFNERMAEIGQIVSLIAGIADQTNLLALNAAIEAARAGEAGRGFAVVAEEVRRLADRTTRSLDDINTLVQEVRAGFVNTAAGLTESLTAVEASVDKIREADEHFQQIGDGVEDSVALVADIAETLDDLSSQSKEVASSAEIVAAKASNISDLGRKDEP